MPNYRSEIGVQDQILLDNDGRPTNNVEYRLPRAI